MTQQPSGFHEFIRKRLVGLKRKPQLIALIVLAAAFLYYSLNLTYISNTTAKIQGNGMGLSGFVTMLFSTLSLVCFLNAFPKRKPVNKPMLILMFVMLVVLIVCDRYYDSCIVAAITRENNPIDVTGANSYIASARSILTVHQIIVICGIALTALLPLYSPLIKKINTNIDIAGNDDMGAIDLSGEDA